MKQLFLALATAALFTTGCHSTDDGTMNSQGHDGSATGAANNGMNGMDTSGHAPGTPGDIDNNGSTPSPSGMNNNGATTLNPQ